jgi:hypothetical protein
MKTQVTHKGNKRFYYYHCRKHHEDREACPNRKHQRAEKVERLVRDLVREAMTDPEQLRADLDRAIELERQGLRGNPERKSKAWLEKLSEIGRMRRSYQEQAAKGYMTFDELGAALRELDESRKTAERELEAIKGLQERIEQMERDRDAILESYADAAPGALDALTSEERHHAYKMGRLGVFADAEGRIEVTGPLVMNPEVCNAGSAFWRR